MIEAINLSAEKACDQRIEARVSNAQKALFQRAAQLSNRSLSEFVIASAQEAATRIIQEHEAMQLTRAE